jgi:basic membrane protein A
VWVERFASDQAAFLAGYVAAGVSKTGAVATYGGVRYDSVTLFMDGFALGVDYYNRANGSKVKLLGWNPAAQEGLFTGDFVDSAAGRRMAESLLDQGADVILPVAGATGIGTAAAVKERGNAYVIGVDTDWALEEEYADVVLTSVMKRVDVGVVSAVKAIVDGSFAGGPHDGTLENGGVDLAPFHHAEAAVPAKVRADLEQIRAGIIAGTIKTQP